jgi:dihydroorotase
MKILIKQARIIDPGGAYHGTNNDILIQNGLIEKVGKTLKTDADIQLEGDQLCVSPGWVDMGVQIGDPGFEHREDISSVSAAAAAGGYSTLLSWPNSDPAVDTKAGVLYIRRQTQGQLVEIHPIGAISKACKGEDITEMIDMQRVGALAFSDGQHSIQSAGLMLRALQYVKSFDGLIINQPQEENIEPHGQMNEGLVSTSLGMKGIPNLAEELMAQRDISLTEYTGSRLHMANISSAGTVELVRQAKLQGQAVTASVPVLNLLFCDEKVESFDVNYKVMPPLRSETDRRALVAGILDGTIDFITSNHTPLEDDRKKLEYPYADFGVIGLETSFGALTTHLGAQINMEQLVQALSTKARSIFSLGSASIEVGKVADLTIFDPSQEWNYTADAGHSKSANSPFIGQRFKGKVLAVINNRRSYFS